MNKAYKVDGTSILKDGHRTNYTGLQIESRDRCYTVRKYDIGETVYMINFREVPALPNTPLVRQMLAEAGKGE